MRSSMQMLRRATLCLAILAAPLAAQGGSGTLTGVAVASESGEPLPYGVVSIPSLGIDRFIGERGTFTLFGLAPGSYTLRVRRIGYTPAQLDVVVRAGASEEVRVVLTRLAVRLAAMRVSAQRECRLPGPPDPARDPALAEAVTQLRMNAEQYRLLTKSYPFRYAMREQRVEQLRRGETQVVSEDTLLIDSEPVWRYEPGGVVSYVTHPVRGPEVKFNVPSLADFADSSFVANHCFDFGGMIRLEGMGEKEFLRIDLMASSSIRSPDVHGAIYLDPENYQIRRSVLQLSRMPRNSSMRSMEVTTLFQEVLPSVPIISAVQARMGYRDNRSRGLVGAVTDQWIIAFAFRGAKPGEEAAIRP